MAKNKVTGEKPSRSVNVQIRGKARDPMTDTLVETGSRTLTAQDIDLDEAYKIVHGALSRAGRIWKPKRNFNQN